MDLRVTSALPSSRERRTGKAGGAARSNGSSNNNIVCFYFPCLT